MNKYKIESREDKFNQFGQSEHGYFYVYDSIGVPHPYVITHHHVGYASTYCGGILGEDAIQRAEAAGHTCGMQGCQLSYREHEQALLVICKKDLKISESEEVNPELKSYLESIVELCEENNYVGFSFLKDF